MTTDNDDNDYTEYGNAIDDYDGADNYDGDQNYEVLIL